jgi:mannose-1-phosphate guanylyltransferase / mannose-6-phosphate isomerase
MDRRIIPLIMCGGAGTRLWPASREVSPKQFLPLFGVRSTFQDTLLRVSDGTLFERPIIITNTAYRFTGGRGNAGRRAGIPPKRMPMD